MSWGEAVCQAFGVYTEEGAGWEQRGSAQDPLSPPHTHTQVLCLRVGEEQLPARVVPMGREEERATLGPGTWGVGLVYLGGPKVLTLLTLSGSSVGTQGLL